MINWTFPKPGMNDEGHPSLLDLHFVFIWNIYRCIILIIIIIKIHTYFESVLNSYFVFFSSSFPLIMGVCHSNKKLIWKQDNSFRYEFGIIFIGMQHIQSRNSVSDSHRHTFISEEKRGQVLCKCMRFE